MKISVELTLSPVQEQYRDEVINFIKRLRTSGLNINETPMSTQVYGEYNEVMKVLNQEIKIAFENANRVMLFAKIVKGDRSGYKANY